MWSSIDGKWKITGFPLETFDTSSVRTESMTHPRFYEGDFSLPAGQAPLDTFVSTNGWGKGYVWAQPRQVLAQRWAPDNAVLGRPMPEASTRDEPLDKPPPVLAIDFIDHPILNQTGNINWWRYQPKRT